MWWQINKYMVIAEWCTIFPVESPVFFWGGPFVGCAKVYCHVDLLAARELPAMDDDGLVDPSYSIEVKDQAGMVTNGWRLPKMMEVWKRWDETAWKDGPFLESMLDFWGVTVSLTSSFGGILRGCKFIWGFSQRMPRSQFTFWFGLTDPTGLAVSLWHHEILEFGAWVRSGTKKPPSKHGHVNLCQYKKWYANSLVLEIFAAWYGTLMKAFF